SLHGAGRIGVADRDPNIEVAVIRSNLSASVYASAYKRLTVAGDWGNPLSFGSSVSAVLFGRDEGFYYRANGVELGGRTERGAPVYGRGALDLTFTEGLGRYAGALTLSGGSSVGGLPPQRRWYLGGTHTIRGQSPDTAQTGDAYWRVRAEVGRPIQGARPVVF